MTVLTKPDISLVNQISDIEGATASVCKTEKSNAAKAPRSVCALLTKWQSSRWKTLPESPHHHPFDWVLIWAPNLSRNEAIVAEEAIEATARLVYKGSTRAWVFHDSEVVLRMLHAIKEGIAEEMIADVRVDGNCLSILLCSFERFDVRFDEVRLLRGIAPRHFASFRLSKWGNRLRWEDYDIDINAHSIRFEADQSYRLACLHQKNESQLRIGKAVRAVRMDKRIRQADFPGLTEREIRRIESGEVSLSERNIEKISEGLGISAKQFLDLLSEKLAQVQE